MKKISVLLILLLVACMVNAQKQDFRSVENQAFKRGEYLKYRVFYDSWLTAWATAGVGIVQVTDENKKYHGRDTYHMVIEGKSKGLFTLFFKVRDRFESYVDEQSLTPWYFIRRTHEGSYKKNDEVTFNHFDHTATSRKKTVDIPPYVQDIVSSFYYVRTFDFSGLEPMDEVTVSFHLDDTVYHSRILYTGVDTIAVKTGTFRCLSFKPMMAKGEVFDEDYPMTLWVSDDKNHIPIMLESEVIIGSVKIELIEYKNLANPLSSKLE
jgi:hypothetical protein